MGLSAEALRGPFGRQEPMAHAAPVAGKLAAGGGQEAEEYARGFVPGFLVQRLEAAGVPAETVQSLATSLVAGIARAGARRAIKEGVTETVTTVLGAAPTAPAISGVMAAVSVGEAYAKGGAKSVYGKYAFRADEVLGRTYDKVGNQTHETGLKGTLGKLGILRRGWMAFESAATQVVYGVDRKRSQVSKAMEKVGGLGLGKAQLTDSGAWEGLFRSGRMDVNDVQKLVGSLAKLNEVGFGSVQGGTGTVVHRVNEQFADIKVMEAAWEAAQRAFPDLAKKDGMVAETVVVAVTNGVVGAMKTLAVSNIFEKVFKTGGWREEQARQETDMYTPQAVEGPPEVTERVAEVVPHGAHGSVGEHMRRFPGAVAPGVDHDAVAAADHGAVSHVGRAAMEPDGAHHDVASAAGYDSGAGIDHHAEVDAVEAASGHGAPAIDPDLVLTNTVPQDGLWGLMQGKIEELDPSGVDGTNTNAVTNTGVKFIQALNPGVSKWNEVGAGMPIAMPSDHSMDLLMQHAAYVANQDPNTLSGDDLLLWQVARGALPAGQSFTQADAMRILDDLEDDD